MQRPSLFETIETPLLLEKKERRLDLFKNFYDTHYNYVKRVLYWLIDKNDIEDQTQEVFIKIWRSFEKFKAKSSEKTWLYRITINTAYDYLRKNKNKNFCDFNEEFMNSSNNQTSIDEDLHMKMLIKKGLNTLPIKQRLPFLLFYKENLNLEEVAKTLRLSKGTIKSRLFHSRKNFITFMNKNGVKKV